MANELNGRVYVQVFFDPEDYQKLRKIAFDKGVTVNKLMKQEVLKLVKK